MESILGAVIGILTIPIAVVLLLGVDYLRYRYKNRTSVLLSELNSNLSNNSRIKDKLIIEVLYYNNTRSLYLKIRSSKYDYPTVVHTRFSTRDLRSLKSEVLGDIIINELLTLKYSLSTLDL